MSRGVAKAREMIALFVETSLVRGRKRRRGRSSKQSASEMIDRQRARMDCSIGSLRKRRPHSMGRVRFTHNL